MGATFRKKGIDQPGQAGQPGQYGDKAVPPGLLFVQAAKELCEAAASMQENPVISAFIGATYASLKDMALQAYPEAAGQIQWQDGVGTVADPADPAAVDPAAADPAAEDADAEGAEGAEDFGLSVGDEDEDSDLFSDDGDEDDENALSDDEDDDEDEDEDSLSDDEDEGIMEDEDEDNEDAISDDEDEEDDEDSLSDDDGDDGISMSDEDEDDEVMEDEDEDEEEDEEEAPPPKAKGKGKPSGLPDFGAMGAKKKKTLGNLDKILEDTTSSVSSLSDSVSGLVERLKKMTGRID